jgi:hypothetical protein
MRVTTCRCGDARPQPEPQRKSVRGGDLLHGSDQRDLPIADRSEG